MEISRLVTTASVAALLAAAIAAPAIAQVSPAASPPAPSGDQDIIVTAQKRSERLSDVPISITAVSGDQLLKQGVTRPSDLQKVVPGFTYEQSSYGVPVFTIRGIGYYEKSLAAPPTVSVYVDQAPLPYSIMTAGASFDLERVEALKGPQGTLFGENATGGAINYIAAKPTKDMRAGIDISYGRFNSVDVQGFVGGPLSSTVRARIAVRTEQHGDWQKSQTRDDTLGQRDFTTARLLLDWEPTDRVKFELSLNGWRDRSDAQAAQFLSYEPAPPFNYREQEPALRAYQRAPDDARIADWDKGTDLRRNNRFMQASLRGDINLGDTTTLTSITALERLKVHIPTDLDGTNVNNYLNTTNGRIHAFSQELRLAGELLQGRAKWVVGGNYARDSTVDDERGDYFASNSGVGPFRYTSFVNSANTKNETKAVFGNLDFNLTDQLTVQGGARYTHSDRRLTGCLFDSGDGKLANAFSFLSNVLRHFDPPFVALAPGSCVTLDDENPATLLTPLPIVKKSLVENNLAWRAGLSWKPDRDVLLYANVTKGYKAGSFATLAAIASSEFRPVTQESVLAYETGFKLSLAANTLQLTGAAYYYNYRNKQIRAPLDTGPPFGLLEALINIPHTSVRGAELTALWRPVRPLTIRAGGSYVDSNVDKSFLSYAPLGQSIDLKGESFPSTPKWQFNGDAQYDFPVGDRLDAYVGGSASYRSRTNASFGHEPLYDVPGYALFDLRAGVESRNGLRAEIWGRNVTDKFYTIHVSHLVDPVQRVVGMPATYGFTVGYRY